MADRKFFWITAGIVFLLTVIPRFYSIQFHLPYHSIDENDIVEFAIAYHGGDLDPHWYKYGPLYSYILSLIYAIAGWLSEASVEEFTDQIFFHGTFFYYTARLFNVLIHLAIAWFGYRLIRLATGNDRISGIALVLLVFPFMDLLTNWTVRVDSLLALWSTLCLLFLIKFYSSYSYKHAVFIGVFFGLSVATKPLPSLLILPTIFLGFCLAYLNSQDHGTRTLQRKGAHKVWRIIVLLTNVLFSRRVFFMALAALITAVATHPYMLLNFMKFLREQRRVIFSDTLREWHHGWFIPRFFFDWGHLFTGSVFIAFVIYILIILYKKNRKLLIIYSFGLIFWLAFAPFPARDYFYVPIVPVLVLCLASVIHYILVLVVDNGLINISPKKALILVFFLLLAVPFYRIAANGVQFLLHHDKENFHTLTAAENFLESNMPPDSRILLIGPTPWLPRLLFSDPDFYGKPEESGFISFHSYGEFFQYNRSHIDGFYEKFRQTHAQEVDTASAIFHNGWWYRQPSKEEVQKLMSMIEDREFDYLITSLNIPLREKLWPYLWKSFTLKDHYFGPNEVYIYKFTQSHSPPSLPP